MILSRLYCPPYKENHKVQTKHCKPPQILIWPMRKAVACNIGLTLVLMFWFTLFSDFSSFFYPLSWIENGITTFLSSWPLILLLVLTIYIQGEIFKRDYTTGKVYFSTRFQKLKYVIGVRKLLSLLCHMVMGATTLWIYSSIQVTTCKYFATRSCDQNCDSYHQHCLDEGIIFWLAGVFWIGVNFSRYYLFGSRNLLFPLIQRVKFFRIKEALINNLSNSLQDSKLPTFLFIILFYFFGDYIHSIFPEFLSVTSRTEVPVDTVKDILLNFRLVSCLWLFSSLFIVSLKMMELLFSIYFTEQYEFLITSENEQYKFLFSQRPTVTLPSKTGVSLIDALKKTDVPIILHFAYLDLFSIATKKAHRREEIFNGDHPSTWNAIFHESLTLIRTFTKELSDALQPIVNEESNYADLKEAQKPTVSKSGFYSHNMRRLASPVRAHSGRPRPNKNPRKGKIGLSIRMRERRIRMINKKIKTKKNENKYNKKNKQNESQSAIKVGFNKIMKWLYSKCFNKIMKWLYSKCFNKIMKWLNSKLHVFVEWFYKIPCISYFFSESPDFLINYLLCQSQSVVWAAQGLSFLSVASLTEYTCYGIGRYDVPKLITALVELKQVLDILNMPSFTEKYFSHDPLECKMKVLLKSSVERSMYIIYLSLGPHLKALKIFLPAHIEDEMKKFIFKYRLEIKV